MDDPLIGTKINRYEILDCLHKTDLIGLYKVFDTKLERNATMKLVFHSSSYSKDFIEYFLSESRSLAKMSHPNIARILDFGYDGGNLYLISEYHSRRTLAEVMTGPIAWRQVIETLIPLTEALSYAHSQGIIHRDLKPENITLAEDSRPILNDFSLIRMIESEETRDMTGTNVGLGSPAYISPEQGKGMTIDFRSDIYSLGIIFFEMITGRKPFSAGTSMEIVIQHVMVPPPSPTKFVPELPDFVEEIVLTSLSKDVEKRYQNMEEFANALGAALVSTGPRKKKTVIRMNARVLAGISALVLVLIVFSVVAVRGRLWGTDPGVPLNATEAAGLTPEAVSSIEANLSPTVEIAAPSPIPEESETNVFPEAAFTLPSLPVLSLAPVPAAESMIDKNNAKSLVELARWGSPSISQFAFIEKDRALLSATSAGIYYFDPADLGPRYFFDAKGWITAFTVSADGEWVAAGDTTGSIAIWNISDGKEIARLQADSKPIKSLDFSPDKSMLVSNAVGKTARLWDLGQKLQLFALEGHGLNISRVLFSPEGDTVITAGEDFKILVWDVRSGKVIRKYNAAIKINDMSLSSDGNFLAVALNNATIEIWDLGSQSLINTIRDPEIVAPYSFVEFLPSNQLILTGSADGIARVWNIQASDMLWQTSYQDALVKPSPVKSMAVSNNGTRFITLFEDEHIELWNLSDQTLEISKSLDYEPIKQVSISPDDHTVAYQRGDSFVEIWSFPDANQRTQIGGTLPRGDPFSADSQSLIIYSEELQHYSLATTKPELIFSYFGLPANGSVNYLQNDRMVAGSSTGVIKYWSTSTGKELRPGALKNESNCRVIYGRNGNFLAAGSINGVISTEANLRYFCQVPRGSRTTSESFLPDGSIIALSQENQTVELWNLHSDGQKSILHSESPGDMLGVAFSGDGKLLATSSAGGTIEIYDLATMKLINTLDLHTGPVNHVLFSHDGTYIITGSTDGIVRFFGLHP
ncbi:MAG: hypothetical protein EHM33_09120 [Chloroflexi bacterium]|nr:MAG: hypothetical protein EHM33_09120 [Chloroflexota bacterium]